MESERNPLRKWHGRYRRGADIGRIQDDEAADVGGFVVDVDEQPTVVFGAGVERHEHGFAGDPLGAEVMGGRFAGDEVAFDERVLFFERRHRMAETVFETDQVLGDSRKLDPTVVEGVFGDGSVGEIECPTMQSSIVLELGVLTLQLGVAGDVDDDLAALVLERVHGVEHVARVDVEPLHVIGAV